MRNTLGQLLLAAFLLGGCEDNKLVTPPPAEAPSQAQPTQASPTQATLTPDASAPAPHMHGATGVGNTEPAPERAPAKAPDVPTASAWGQKGSADAGTAPDGGSSPRLDDREEGARPSRQGPPSGEAKGPIHP